LGEGCIRWTECLKLLAAANYQGWLVLENFSRLERGPDRIAEDLAWLEARKKEV
jgi:sugar phosphate isomerase/epimerase